MYEKLSDDTWLAKTQKITDVKENKRPRKSDSDSDESEKESLIKLPNMDYMRIIIEKIKFKNKLV